VQHDEEPAEAPVAVVERVQRLELIVRHRGGDDRVDGAGVIVLEPGDEVAQAGLEMVTGRGGMKRAACTAFICWLASLRLPMTT
jgi:hypothetical protein